MENKKVLLSVKDLEVKFRVRGRTLTAIRGVSLDFHENESVAIVGESGSGKSVFTKTFAGMLETNGYISNGSIIFSDDDLADTSVLRNSTNLRLVRTAQEALDRYAKLEHGADIYKQMLELESEKKQRATISAEEDQAMTAAIDDLVFKRTELANHRQTIDSKHEKERYNAMGHEIAALDQQIKDLRKKKEDTIKAHKKAIRSDSAYLKQFDERMAQLKAQYAKAIEQPISQEVKARDEIIAKEICLSVGRFGFRKRNQSHRKLLNAMKEAMKLGVDLFDEEQRNSVFDSVVFRVKYLDENTEKIHGVCVLNLAKIQYAKDWNQIRGGKIATVFQDPMTSLNPIITIGKQITSVILKHQNCTELEARARALELMKKVGIPNAESRFDDDPFQ